MKKLIVLFFSLFIISTSVYAAEIPPESLPSNATFECMEYTETLISDILDTHNDTSAKSQSER